MVIVHALELENLDLNEFQATIDDMSMAVAKHQASLARFTGSSNTGNGGTAALLGIPGRLVEFDLADDIIFKGAKVLGINGRLMYKVLIAKCLSGE